jgi:hypothetical protein
MCIVCPVAGVWFFLLAVLYGVMRVEYNDFVRDRNRNHRSCLELDVDEAW